VSETNQSTSAPARHHMRISATGRIPARTMRPRISGYRPCADVIWKRPATFADAMSIGVILTGMGNEA